jgi:hypothetical protein
MVKRYFEAVEFWRVYALLGFSALMLGVSGCASSGVALAPITPAQAGQILCLLAADGATVTAVFANSQVAAKAGALAPVACALGTQVGQVLVN